MSAVPDWLETFWHHAQTNDHVCGHQPSTKATLVLIAEYCLMKKHLITSVSLLTLALSSHAYANESLIEQSMLNMGDQNNDAVVNQTAGRGGDADVSQIGRDNLARVTQSDTQSLRSPVVNDADIIQRGRNARGRIEQKGRGTGTANIAEIKQYSAGTDALPSGYAVNAKIFQRGIENNSTITQGSSGAKVSGVTARNEQRGFKNGSTIKQTASASPLTRSLVTQKGQNNKSETSQAGSLQRILVDQKNDGNQSFVTQQRSVDMTASVLQRGDSKSTIDQVSRKVDAIVKQYGSTQFSDIKQKRGSKNSLAEVTQHGAQNRSEITQHYANNDTGANRNETTATVKQSSSANQSEIMQGTIGTASYGLTATVTQRGNNGRSTIKQSGALQSATLVQSGTRNSSFITQRDDSHTANVTQSMRNNKSRIHQKGSSHTATVFQTASAGNLSIIRQRGKNNTATVRQ